MADHPQPGPNVTVTINDQPKEIHRGSHKVSELKTLLGVPVELVLEEAIDGKLVGLADDGRTTIKGGESFYSHGRTGGSS